MRNLLHLSKLLFPTASECLRLASLRTSFQFHQLTGQLLRLFQKKVALIFEFFSFCYYIMHVTQSM